MDVLFDANTMRTHRLRGREGDNQHKDNSSGRLLRGESNTSLFAGNCCGSTQMAVSGLRLVVLLYLASAAFGQVCVEELSQLLGSFHAATALLTFVHCRRSARPPTRQWQEI